MENRLKPMGIRDILDTTFSIMRERFWTFKLMIIKAFMPSSLVFLGMLLISLVYLLIVSSIIKIPIINAEFWKTFFPKTLVSSIIMVLFLFILLIGFAVSFYFGQIYFIYGSVKLFKTGLHNEPCPFKTVFTGIKGKRLNIFLVHLLIGILLLILSIPGFIATIAVIFIYPAAGQIVNYLNRFLVFGLGLFVCLSPVVVVIEDLDVMQSISRAFKLPAKHRWRLFGTMIMTYLFALLILSIFIGLLTLSISLAFVMKNFAGYFIASILSLVILFFFIIFLSFGFGPLVAIYYDLKIRKEGYDLQLQMAADETAPDTTNPGWSLNN